MPMPRILRWLPLLIAAGPAVGDGIGIAKVETPYTQLLEQELEYNTLYSDGDQGSQQRHELSYGRALASHWFGEVEAIGVREAGSNIELEAFALELKHQFTEQGEYSSDWGWQTELERGTEHNQWELSNMLIGSRDWGPWTGTANLAVIYEWGDHLDSEVETRFAGQLKYRRGMAWEPALELHLGQNTRGLGPVVTGAMRLGQRKKLLWEVGAILGLDRDTPDVNLKANLEYEF
jgi:hypothetical protein